MGGILFATVRAVVLVALGLVLSSCITTSMQGYADRELPQHPVSHIIAYVTGPAPLVGSIQADIRQEAAKRRMAADDALNLFPPTRIYTDAEIRKGLGEAGIDGVLIINVGDTGVVQQYAGTILSGQYTATSFGPGNGYGTVTTTATPVYNYRRQTAFNAKLLDPVSSRNLWVGNGQVNAGGLLFVGDGASASSSVSAIFDDLQKKGIIAPTS
jgi:hypothetical protein